MDPKHSHGPDRVDYQELPGDLTEVHAAIQREHPEPTAETTPVPMWLIATCGFAVLWAGIYMGVFNGGLKGDVFNELNATAGLLFPLPTKGHGAGGSAAEPSLAEQGKSVYANCQTCHQATGLGAPGQFPPLAKSDFVTGSEKRLVAIILKGLQGPITVNGATYNGAMPPWEGALNNKKIAAVATFVRANFGNSAPEINEVKVAAARTEFTSQTAPWTAEQILQIPADATLAGGDAAAPAPAAGSAAPAAGGATAPAGSAPAAPGAAPTSAPAPASQPGQPAAPAPGTPAPPAPAAAAPAAQPTASAPAGGAAPAAVAAATPEQVEAGKRVYMTVCFACHQITGMGLPMVFPPLVKSPYVNGPAERLVAMVLKGNIGPMTVDGKPYNNVMPPQEAMLDDAKIAAVTTYVRASFGNSAPPVTAEQVAAARKKFAERKTSWTQAELDAWKE